MADEIDAAATPWRSASCDGERCYCGYPAAAKVEETIFADDPASGRHPLTAYLCRPHFRAVMGAGVERVEEHRALVVHTMSREARAKLERLNGICAEYENGGFHEPGRTIDAIRDVLGRRGG